MTPTLDPAEIDEMERRYAGTGVSVAEVLELFRSRGMPISEGTFRKYVQVGLLPRSRRVGRKGRNRGSRGVYPASVIRRLHAVKAMMAEGMTLEEIRGSYLHLRGDLDVVEQAIAEIAGRIGRAIEEVPMADRQQEAMSRELARVQEQAARLIERIERLAGRVVAARAAAAQADEAREEP